VYFEDDMASGARQTARRWLISLLTVLSYFKGQNSKQLACPQCQKVEKPVEDFTITVHDNFEGKNLTLP
jgi:hypothetical protein